MLHTPWPDQSRRYIDLVAQLLSGHISPGVYRDTLVTTEFLHHVWTDSDPVYPIIAQLRHDANEFVPSDDVRDETDMSSSELLCRAGFARDALAVTVAYWTHITQKC